MPPAQVAIAADYMSIDAAQHAFYGQANRFDEIVLALNPSQKQKVAQLAGAQPPHRSLRAWKAMRGSDALGYVFVDEVLGRQDMITYAVAIDAGGKMSAIEVLSYRESHGGEIRGTAWRRQFEGRQGVDHLRVGTDIKNIAGATLSCEHVTQGARWIAALWQVMLRLPPVAAEIPAAAAMTPAGMSVTPLAAVVPAAVAVTPAAVAAAVAPTVVAVTPPAAAVAPLAVAAAVAADVPVGRALVPLARGDLARLVPSSDHDAGEGAPGA